MLLLNVSKGQMEAWKLGLLFKFSRFRNSNPMSILNKSSHSQQVRARVCLWMHF